VLSRLPNLRTLWLNDWDLGAAGPLPAGLTKLRALQIVEPTGLRDLRTLSHLRLEQLALWTDDPVSLAGIEAMSSLRTLHLVDEHLRDLEPLAGLANLRSIRVPSKLRPAAFAAFVRTHPQLVVLDLIGNLTLSDLTPVGELTHLEGLVIDGPVDHLGAIRSLTSLRYVGISEKVWDTDPDEVDAIRKALPDAVVVRVSPLCLGSGWVVVVVLAPLAMRGWRRWRALRARSR
jgi:hypothetical protein